MTELPTPETPVVLWDGECGFCRRWVDHWRAVVGKGVEFREFQAVPGTFLERHGLSPEELSEAMHLVDAAGVVYRGAGAVFAALRHSGELPYRALDAVYRAVPPFAAIAEWKRKEQGLYCPTFALDEAGSLEVAASVGRFEKPPARSP